MTFGTPHLSRLQPFPSSSTRSSWQFPIMAGVRDVLLFSSATAAAATTTYHPNIGLLPSGDHHIIPLFSPSPFANPVPPPTPSSKKPRSSATYQDGSFKESLPRQVRAPATFKCVRLTTVGGGGTDADFAYQAVVRIGGHVFKGVLYRQGRTVGDLAIAGDGNSNDSGESVRRVSELHLRGGVGNGIISGNNR